MNDHREIGLTRDCDAIQIPSGNPIVLPEGMNVIIHPQSLGGTYTVATPGGLARIELRMGMRSASIRWRRPKHRESMR